MAETIELDPITGLPKKKLTATDPYSGQEFSAGSVNTETPSYKAYNPDTAGVQNIAGSATGYESAQGSAIKQLSDMITNGGLSAQQKATYYNAGAGTINDTAAAQKEAAQQDAYARGLGQSGVLSRSYGNVDKNTQQSLANLQADIESKSEASLADAISKVQSGIKSQQETALQKAQLAQQGEELRATLAMDENNYTKFMTQLKSTESMSNADRELALEKLAADYGLSKEELDQAKEQADREFWGDILGGGISGIASLLGGPAAGASASILSKLLGL